MSGTLVSPGVKVSIVDESAYAASGPGTVPLIVIATASNKLAPGSTTTIAPGTLDANAGNLYLITSQRDALQTFGNPTFYSSAGSVQYNNELNELGLFTLYTYLGVANNAYVIRANVDLDQLIPSTTAPTGPTTNGTYWLDLASTTWGIFQSNGNINPAYAWQSQTPLVIADSTKLRRFVQGFGTTPITSGSASCITISGNLVINNVAVAMPLGISISQVASNINTSVSLQLLGISATVYIRPGKYSKTSSAYGDIFDLRIISDDYMQTITLAGSTPSVLTNLGFTADPENHVHPVSGYGIAGNYAVNTLENADGLYSNSIFQQITITSSSTTTNWWFQVGTTEIENPGFSWQGAVPTVLTGNVPNPTLVAGEQATIQIGAGSILTVSVPSAPNNTLAGFVGAINTQLNSGSGTNAVASITTQGGLNYLTITNYDATQIYLKDLSDQYGGSTPWEDCGLSPTNTYWGSVTGSISNPTYVASTLETQSASVVAPGSAYLVGDPLTVSGGTAATATVLTVSSLQVVGANPNAPGSGYRVNDTLTFGSNDANYTSTVIVTVDAISGGGGITGVTITQAGQFTGVTPPTTNTSASATSGSGIGATIDLTWGVNTVAVTTPGSYTVYPTNPASITGGNGVGATFNLVSTWLQSTSFSITLPGLTPTIIHIPALTGVESAVTVADVVAEINSVYPSGPIVASTVNNQLIITNNNGTAFTLEDLRGSPLAASGIAAGVTFARTMVYQGYSPSLTVPGQLSQLAANNVWLNTTPAGMGTNLVVKEYVSGEWIVQNTVPNTGTIPLYSTTSAADAAFGGLKGIGSIFGQYNYYGLSPAVGNIVLQRWNGSSWEALDYVPGLLAPNGPPVNGTLWYNTALQVDIMVNNGQQWLGYRNLYPGTDPNGPILSSAQPVTQSTGAALVDYDIWVNTDVTPYPAIYRYNAITGTWTQIDNTNHVDSAGIIFADARATANGQVSGQTAESVMVLSNYVDPDAPDPLLYPPYMLLFNTRYSTYNVKQWVVNYFPQNYNTIYPTDVWVTFSGNAPDGSPYMGPAAQRAVVVNALNAALVDSTDARASQNYFNLISTPGYPECIAEMVNLNVDINNVAFVVGDTPSTLLPTGTSIQNWATNAANAATDSDVGLVTHSSYLGLWYPWGFTPDLQGNNVVVPPSLIALTTIAYSDSVSYPWFAPAGFNRGLVSSVSSVGYLTSAGSYVPVTLNQGQRDVLYTNDINPIAYMPGRGLVVWGQKTLDPVQTALNRINVARLVNYLSWNLNNLAQPFLFEQNDSTTRANVTAVFTSYLQTLVGLRALYDFSVICDSSNNTPATIDANQLWIDIAIQPEIAIEFIYIPVRVLATGTPLPKTVQ
jgi:phage tail sheath protein FI